MDIQRKEFKLDFLGREIAIEVSRLAEQATSAVLARYGGTSVLATVVMGREDRGTSYLPLVVDYEERFYAAGKIYGSRFIRREGRPSDEAVLSGRVIDRTIRPLFDQRIRRDIQITLTILEIDEESDPDFIALLAVSSALTISSVPWNGPVAGIKILRDGSGKAIFNPLNSLVKEALANKNLNGEFVAFVAGSDEKINMIELEGVDAQESDVVDSFAKAHEEIQRLIDFQNDIAKKIGAKKEAAILAEPDQKMKKEVCKFLKDELEQVIFINDKTLRQERETLLRNSLREFLVAKGLSEKDIAAANNLFEDEVDRVVHEKIIEENKRPDGRRLDEVRDLYAEAGMFKRTHGSALFVRGTTQALAVTTLASPEAEQLIETIEFAGKRRFMLHYNFPPFSVGEVGLVSRISRREIGHGNLAEKAIRNLIPSKEDFPYTIRTVSEILSSNGSSSMATVCAVSLSLMDAGVPLKKPVAGIAMGLMTNPDGKYKILTDIQGPEDHHGDMDLKAAGTRDGITAIQMDVKIDGVTPKILLEGLHQARKARLEILDLTDKILSKPRPELSPYAPVILAATINPIHIGEVIGPGGKVINGIIEKNSAQDIDLEQDGRVYVTASTREAAQAAMNDVLAIARDFHVGDIVEGEIVKILDFGAIMQLSPYKDGMIHISELKNGFVKKVEDVVKIGDRVSAQIISIDSASNKISLSLKKEEPAKKATHV